MVTERIRTQQQDITYKQRGQIDPSTAADYFYTRGFDPTGLRAIGEIGLRRVQISERAPVVYHIPKQNKKPRAMRVMEHRVSQIRSDSEPAGQVVSSKELLRKRRKTEIMARLAEINQLSRQERKNPDIIAEQALLKSKLKRGRK